MQSHVNVSYVLIKFAHMYVHAMDTINTRLKEAVIVGPNETYKGLKKGYRYQLKYVNYCGENSMFIVPNSKTTITCFLYTYSYMLLGVLVTNISRCKAKGAVNGGICLTLIVYRGPYSMSLYGSY